MEVIGSSLIIGSNYRFFFMYKYGTNENNIKRCWNAKYLNENDVI